MSIAVLIVTHGNAAQALLTTAEMIIGKQDNVHCLDFMPGENGETLAEKMRQATQKLNLERGLLIVVDLWGGTPFNAANTVANEQDKTEVITGVNVPMLVSLLLERDDQDDLSALAQLAINEGKDGIKALKTALQSTPEKQSNAQVAPAQPAQSAQSAHSTPAQSSEQDSAPVSADIAKLRQEASEKVKEGPHMSFGLWRIDDRLIHGQVATRWTKETGVNRIIIVNDDVVKDTTRTTMLKQAVPSGVSAHVVGIDKMMRVYNNPQYANDRVMLLFTNPSDALELVRRGVPIQSINIGGMAYREGRTMLDTSVSVNDKDVEAFKELDKHGIELEVRKVASDRKVPVLQLIADKYSK